jgi:hypothetical protein
VPGSLAWLAAAVLLAASPLLAEQPPAMPAVDEAAPGAAAPPVPPGEAGPGPHRNEVEQAWFAGGAGLGARATEARRVALARGLEDAEGPARALIAPAREDGELAEALLAVKLAPDLPLAHVALAAVRWQDGEFAAALRSLLAAVAAVPRNLEATLWLASSLLVLFAAVLAVGSLLFIAIVGASVFPRAAHDLGDMVSSRMPGFARAALMGSLVALPVALGEGVLGLAIALLVLGAMYGGARHRSALALASAMLVLGMFPLAQFAGRALSMLSADPVAESALAVRQGIQSRDDIALLRAFEDGDRLAAQALAVDASQRGDIADALARYEALAAQAPQDPVIATNLANLHFRSGAVDEAVALYQTAAKSLDSSTLWFNLSQAYARSFRMEPFETALSRAQQLGDDTVAELSQHGDPNFVADLPLPIEKIRGRMLAASQGAGFGLALRAPIAPGRLGADWRLLGGVLAGLLLGAVALSAGFDQAGSCSRCGVRVCGRCDGSVWDSHTCDNCHRLYHYPESTDPALRAARLEQLRAREARIERAAQLGSFAVPGLGGMLADRPDLGFLAILFFGWAVGAVALRSGVVPDPLVLGLTGPLVLMSMAIFAGLGYVLLVFASVAIRRSR